MDSWGIDPSWVPPTQEGRGYEICRSSKLSLFPLSKLSAPELACSAFSHRRRGSQVGRSTRKESEVTVTSGDIDRGCSYERFAGVLYQRLRAFSCCSPDSGDTRSSGINQRNSLNLGRVCLFEPVYLPDAYAKMLASRVCRRENTVPADHSARPLPVSYLPRTLHNCIPKYPYS